jgi:hypothetical protein
MTAYERWRPLPLRLTISLIGSAGAIVVGEYHASGTEGKTSWMQKARSISFGLF